MQEEDGDGGDEFVVDTKTIRDRFSKLSNVRRRLEKLYQSEFVNNLMLQATDRKGRYGRVTHEIVEIGDLVSIIAKNQKPNNYPMAIITKVEKNSLGEVVSVEARKSNREIVRRHSEDIILQLKRQEDSEDEETARRSNEDAMDPTATTAPQRKKRTGPKRKAATNCNEINRLLLEE